MARFLNCLITVCISLLGEPAFAQKGGPKATGPLVVVDSGGRTVGRFLSVQPSNDLFQFSTVMALITVNNGAYAVPLGPPTVAGLLDVGSLTWVANATIYYQSTDCTGPSFGAVAPIIAGFMPAGIAYDGVRYLLYPLSSVQQNVSYGSRLGISCVATNGTTVAHPVTGAPVDLTPFFTPPFSIQLQ